MKQKGKWDEQTELQIKQKYVEKYDKESNAYYASSRLWDDGVILPSSTRQILGLSLLITGRVNEGNYKHGVFRMWLK